MGSSFWRTVVWSQTFLCVITVCPFVIIYQHYCINFQRKLRPLFFCLFGSDGLKMFPRGSLKQSTLCYSFQFSMLLRFILSPLPCATMSHYPTFHSLIQTVSRRLIQSNVRSFNNCFHKLTKFQNSKIARHSACHGCHSLYGPG